MYRSYRLRLSRRFSTSTSRAPGASGNLAASSRTDSNDHEPRRSPVKLQRFALCPTHLTPGPYRRVTGMTYRCPACANSSHRTPKALASHRRFCKPYKMLPAHALRSRLEQFRLNQSKKQAVPQEPLAMDVDAGQPQVCFSVRFLCM
jgi:hypothetical protein